MSIIIDPSEITVVAGEQQSFSATISDVSSTSIDWIVSGAPECGTITSDGVYTAPNVGGVYTVIAKNHDYPQLQAMATVRVPEVITLPYFTAMRIFALNALAVGTNCASEGAEVSTHGLPVVWNGNDFSVSGTTNITTESKTESYTISISGRLETDGTISLSASGSENMTDDYSFWNYMYYMESTSNIVIDHAPRHSPFSGDIDYQIWHANDRHCLKSVHSTDKLTKTYRSGGSEIIRDCEVNAMDWESNGQVNINVL